MFLAVALLPFGALPVGASLTGTVEVMPLGDSITVGVLGSSNGTGYRRELWRFQVAAGHTLNFVGSGSTGVPNDFDKNHEGHSGMRADEINAGVTGWLNANPADVVLLHIGTNDITQGQSAASTAGEIGQILDKIKAVDNTTWVILAKIVPRNDGDNTLQQRTTDLNNRIANLAANRSAAGDRVKLVDMNGPLNPASDLVDGIHPDDSGYSKMAGVWDSALDALLTPVQDTTRPVITLVGGNPQTVEVGGVYVERGATATDNADGDLSDEVVIDASGVKVGKVGTYQVRYNVSDAAGNEAVEKVRTVQVLAVEVDTGRVCVGPGGCDQIGYVDGGGRWHIADEVGWGSDDVEFFFGNPGDSPFMGDWDGDGVETPGLYRRSDGYVYLRNSNTEGIADTSFFFGNPGDVPLVGDFDGDGRDTVSLYRPAEGRFYVINRLGSGDGGLGVADFSFVFGNPGDKPFVGDFDGNGVDEVGLHRETTGRVYFRFSLTGGVADRDFIFGNPGDVLVAGDWEGDGVDTVAVYRPSDGNWYIKGANTQGVADHVVYFGDEDALVRPFAGRAGTSSR